MLALGQQCAQALHRVQVFEAEQQTRIQAEASEARYRKLFNGVGDAVLVTDQAGRYLDVNDAAVALYGYSAEEFRAMHIGDLAPSTASHLVTDEDRQALLGEARRREGQGRRRDGSDVAIDWLSIPLDLPTGRVFLTTVRDLTERQRAEIQERQLIDEQVARLAAEQAVRERDRFLSVAAHELRTPVAGVQGYTDLLRRAVSRGVVTPDQLARYSDALGEGTKRLTTLTNDLLDIARLQHGQLALRPAKLDVATIASRAVSRYRDLLPSNQQIAAEIESVWVDGDVDRLDQVVTNLIENASKYSPAGGTIRVSLHQAAESVVLTIQDEGIGIPVEAADHIFEPFGRAPNAEKVGVAGVGLGLYICRQIVERHGGTIRAESAGEGCGTRFVVTLPTIETPLDSNTSD